MTDPTQSLGNDVNQPSITPPSTTTNLSPVKESKDVESKSTEDLLVTTSGMSRSGDSAADNMDKTPSNTKEADDDNDDDDNNASSSRDEDDHDKGRDHRNNDNGAEANVEVEEDSVKKGEREKEEEENEENEEDEEDDDDDEDENDDDDDDDEEEEEEEEDEEPQLKYARLTQHLGSVYRNGDATSSFLVAGDKMIVGTHNGNIHVIQLPMFQPLRVYHAHSASVTGISISPFPPPLPTEKPEPLQRTGTFGSKADSIRSEVTPVAASRKPREPLQIPRIPSNDIYIATSSMDGNICIQSLIDLKDVQLRNFARPVQAVALSPEYKTDRTYLSGGLAGQLILTVGGGPGRSTSTTTGTMAAATSGWLGSMGLGTNTGKDTVLHSGEGTISTIKWSLSGKYAVWLNEHGIKLVRTNLHLDSAHPDDAWKRIGHYDRPQTEEWETMASVWKGRVEWIDEQGFETQDGDSDAQIRTSSPAAERLRDHATASKRSVERLLVGWGGTIWIMNVHPSGMGTGKNAGERVPGRPEIVKILRLDCIISGISLYTQNLLLVLAYCLPEDDNGDDDDDDAADKTRKPISKGHHSQPSTSSMGSQPSGGIKRRQNHERPELRLIDLDSQEEVDRDSLSVSRYERLGSGDYHLGILPPRNAAAVVSSRGALEALAGIGTDVWNAAINPRSLFSSGASIRSYGSGDDSSVMTSGILRPSQVRASVHPGLVKPGAKIFIHSPYDCILATKRDLADHLGWLLERQQYRQAWELLNENPDILNTNTAQERSTEALPASPLRNQDSEDFFDDESIVGSSYRGSGYKNMYSSAEKEKRRIGELWLQELVEEGNWREAGQVCNRVLTTPDRWEKWVYTFAGAKRFDDIAYSIPSVPMKPSLPKTIYEVVLGHYIKTDKPRFKELLDRWSTDLFEIKTITTALENQLKFRDVREDNIEDGEKGRDWRIVMEALGRLHEANGRHREALKCYIKLQDADSTFRLIKENHLADAVADDIPSFIGLRVSVERLSDMIEKDLEEATSEAITLLVDEAQHGLVRPEIVVEQLQAQELHLYLYFYLRGLWKGDGLKEHTGENLDRLVMESQSLVDDFADLAVHLFAMYNRQLLMDFLKSSTSYILEKAVQECEVFCYYDELVYLYSKTGQMKRALYLIIDRLKNVYKAIEFAKEQDDADLWDDLLDYSMDKPGFIRGLLEQAGTAVDPISLVRRIPEGLKIPGLREGLTHMMKEHEIQYSISYGVARVLRSEVSCAQGHLRARQRKGVKFEVVVQSSEHIDVEVKDPPPPQPKQPAVDEDITTTATQPQEEQENHDHRDPQPGHCAKCHEAFTEYEMETLVGYSCGHVFHTSHLLEMVNKKAEVADLRAITSMDDDGATTTTRYSVGGKVMRARLLRDKIRGGCPICH